MIFIKRISIFALLIMLISGCKEELVEVTLKPHEVCNKWADLTLYILQYTGANSPTFASRTIGYIGLTMYESVVHADTTYQSLAGQLNDLDQLPLPDQNRDYLWEVSLNAGQAEILRNIYVQTSDENKVKIDSLENAIVDLYRKAKYGEQRIDASVAFGKAIGSAIFEWSKKDGGHRAYLQNFDKDWKHPEFEGAWQPPLFAQSFSHHPLHPHWGSNRTFLKENSKLPIPKMIPVSSNKASEYFKQFVKVYEKDLNLTQTEKETALWWGDDPDDSFTPPGHSYFIANKVVKQRQPNLIESAETFARVGLAVADAFINCWKWKYHHFTERANTYIPKHIDESWESFWPDPPFPAFPSGHAINGGAMATVLGEMYGDAFSFIDDAHVHRERDEVRDVDFIARSFSSFWEVAEEIADSRFYGGIHIPYDNEVGLEEGRKIASRVNALNWRKKRTDEK